MSFHPAVRIASVACVLACGPTAPEPSAPTAVTQWPQVSAADAYFPLIEGNLYHYVTDENGEPGMLVANVRRLDATHGSLRIGASEKRFVYDAKGVAYEGGAYVLQLPLAVGTRWPGEHGGETSIRATGITLGVPAGKYAECIETFEVANEIRYVNTYCPDVGLARIDVTSARGEAHIILQRYGAPVKID